MADQNNFKRIFGKKEINSKSDLDVAMAEANKIIVDANQKMATDNANIQKELAMCNIINGDFENGIKYLIKAITLEPDNIDVQMQLALVHEMIEEEQMALMIYQKIIETNPEYLRAYIQKATLYMHLGDYVNSAFIFKKIIKIKPCYYRALLALGICFEKLSNMQAAVRYYKKYLKTNPLADNFFDIKYRIKEYNSTRKRNINNLKIINI